LYAVLKIEQQNIQLRCTTIAALSLFVAIIFFVSPPMGLAAYCILFVSFIMHVAPSRWPSTVLIVVLTLTAVVTPWTIRNYIVMGEPIVLRSNLGLELS